MGNKVNKNVIVSILGMLFLNACEKSVVSKDYYVAHLNEAKEEITKCTNNKNENSVSCDNAHEAIADNALKEQRAKTTNNM